MVKDYLYIPFSDILIMKIRLKKGKQRELIFLVKKDLSWKELSKILEIPEGYLCRDIKNEKFLISEEVYNKICSILQTNFDSFILEKLPDNWGRSLGGLNSEGSTKKIIHPPYNKKLAEFIGAVLGDGHVFSYKRGKKIGVYGIRIAGDINLDKDYHLNYLSNISKDLFDINTKEILKISENHKERFLDLYSKELVIFFGSMGIKPGNKIKNQSTIPKWIFEKDSYLKACLRGLIDTDGSIFKMSNKDPNLLRINFTNHNRMLLLDTQKGFKKLGYNTSKIISNKQFFISRQGDIKKYLKEIGFSNKKHLDRVKTLAP